MPIIKKIPKKPRMSQKQKQRQSVNQTVVVNQQPATRRRGPNKPTNPSGGGGGGGGGGGQGPSPAITYAPYQMTNAAPQSNQQEFAAEVARQVIKQSVPNIVRRIPDNFGENRALNQPYRLEPASDNLNRENITSVDAPLNNFDRAPPPPSPVDPDIVLQPNRVIQRAVKIQPSTILTVEGFPVGFTENQSRNDLDMNTEREQIETQAYGGDIGPTPDQLLYAVGPTAIIQSKRAYDESGEYEERNRQSDQQAMDAMRSDSYRTAVRHASNIARIETILADNRVTEDRVKMRDALGYYGKLKFSPGHQAVLRQERESYHNSGK